ncbi:MAG: hypothetical protein OEY86_07290 [Nitrospira sp.]|nr:hypothetical protein [Nitrospira sp.]
MIAIMELIGLTQDNEEDAQTVRSPAFAGSHGCFAFEAQRLRRSRLGEVSPKTQEGPRLKGREAQQAQPNNIDQARIQGQSKTDRSIVGTPSALTLTSTFFGKSVQHPACYPISLST